MENLRIKAGRLTTASGVYLMKNAAGQIIYIGKAKNLRSRVSSYFRGSFEHDLKTARMVANVCDFDFIVTNSEFEALVLENSLIKQHSPRYNILLKDGKGYHFVKISEETYPRITVEMQKDGGGTYLGPYVSSYSVRQTTDTANKVFMLPSCNRKFPSEAGKGRPCLNYHINRCMGVCRGNISQESYLATIKKAVEFIKTGEVRSMEELKAQMELASENLEFEKAAKIRDKINIINKITQKQKVFIDKSLPLDVIAAVSAETCLCVVVLIFRNGQLVDKRHFITDDCYNADSVRQELYYQIYSSALQDYPRQIYMDKPPAEEDMLLRLIEKFSGYKVSLSVPNQGQGAKLVEMAAQNAAEQLAYRLDRAGREIKILDELASLLALDTTPDYIEAYDVSNLGDSGIVGGMTVFRGGKPYKNAYKKFSLQSDGTRDDYGSMREMLSRRFTRYLDEKDSNEGFGRLPDLVLIDGGKGHVSAASEVLAGLGLSVPIFGMVKDKKHRTRAVTGDGGEISISANKPVFALLTRIQDETHRFAISYQKNLRKKSAFELGLTSVKGIGEAKALALIKQFKTKSKLKAASIEEIAAVVKLPPERLGALMGYIGEL
ncbi:MAG: excinuclease ABC subunit UvrC [Oscillospiraceae bacterium]|nr:excinuclease ABC subunit UvrC [Oscillospiraceae bacterium]